MCVWCSVPLSIFVSAIDFSAALVLFGMLLTDGPYCPFIHSADDSPRFRRWLLPQRRLTHYLLVTSIDGAEQLRMNGQSVTVPAGGSYLIQPGVLADIGSAGGNRPVWVHFDVRFDPRRGDHPQVNDYAAEYGIRARWLQPDASAMFGVELPAVIPAELAAEVRAEMVQLVAWWKQGGRVPVWRATHALAGVLLRLVEHAWRAAPPAAPVRDDERIQRAEAVALSQLDSDFSVDDFAAAAHLRRSRFCALYRRVRGQSPGAFLRGERLNRAEQLLARNDLTAAQVGALVGYRDPTVFGRAFRARHACSPAAWRAQQAL